ncbi:MAG: hypothetical protein GTN84_10190 [Hydrogenophaga sp.]|uniref:DUF6134 family protein n=1 Tax=Hydrogenophaga sp. TaxID=1904254 RepID=UPI001694E841|nr:DUF6134 family protein [Hydrogenophaga sp.]NIM41458.1 hypothetical protein [Hydrogenophaga sp.]NIN26774.1 hypothetical protein [Hydrogenophaga sp.]NIN31473.1 hypothetical protein [Hydrogenophaga sp.]NIN55704.1 hypothetical protein [Hydrogenophaga sp.]NIO51867.1 hypothetical protein [Hydrogenophaga sp.]
MTTARAGWRRAACLAALLPAALAQASERWDFTVTLDGRPVGTHRFTVSGDAAERRLQSRARFDVRWLGLLVYRYRHEADERWQGECLRELRAETDSDGERETVSQRYGGDCLMGFAYWNPRVVEQQQLIDPQTGRTVAARFERLADARIERLGQSVPARGWQLRADGQRIDIWYAADTGRWIGLDAEVRGGRRLSYRLTSTLPTPQ